MSKLTIVIVAAAIVVLALAAGGVVYLTQPHQAAQKFTLSNSPAPAAASPSALAGTWIVDSGSQAGYRVNERFVDQAADTEAVARTSTVTGQVVVASSPGALQLQSATYSADISKLASTDANATRGNAVRDRFVARIYLESSLYPMATFVAKATALTSTAIPADISVPGTFTVHGISKDVTIPLKVTENADRLEVVGSFQLHYQDYKIEVPSVPFTTAASVATIEVHLFLKRQG